ncbi:hypothetical protein D6783_02755 [Candidatus Woesearchaeota archaeon]|nr:MAG: hypothetical protein D6783_02755 [Candidatus Woesearchaeota archaeon]
MHTRKTREETKDGRARHREAPDRLPKTLPSTSHALPRLVTALLLLTILFSNVPVTFADIPSPVKNPRPTIEITFNEEVIIDAYWLEKTNDPSKRFSVEQITPDPAKTFLFQVTEDLPTGTYTFYVQASNEHATSLETITFTVESPIPEGFRIWVDQPPLGVSPTTPYDVTIKTTEPASCRFSTNYDPRKDGHVFETGFHEFFNEGTAITTTHTLTGQTINRTIFIACKDQEDNVHYEDIYLGYDLQPPLLVTDAEPNPVTNTAQPQTRLSVKTPNDPTVCTYNDKQFPNNNPQVFDDYQEDHEVLINYTYEELLDEDGDVFGRKERTYTITCTDLGGNTATQDQLVIIDLAQELAIQKISPPDLSGMPNPVEFTVQTPTQATCELKYADLTEFQPFQVSTGTTFTEYMNLEDGTHTVDVQCDSSIGSASETFTFTLDRTIPYNNDTSQAEFTIQVQEPPLGVSPTTPYTAIITTNKEAQCRYNDDVDPRTFGGTFQNYFTPFDEGLSAYTKTHTITDRNKSGDVYLACKEEDGTEHYDAVYLGYDPDPPTPQTRADPDPVVDTFQRTTTLTVTTPNDPTVCTYNGKGFPGYNPSLITAYKDTHMTTIAYSLEDLYDSQTGNAFGEKQFTYDIVCTDRAGWTGTDQYTVTVDLAEDLAIEKLSPKTDIVKTLPVNFTIATSVTANCTLTYATYDEPKPFMQSNNNIFTELMNLGDGIYQVNVQCASIQGNASAHYTFKVDTTGSTNSGFRIWVDQPPLGVSPTKPFDVRILTSEPANCKYHEPTNPLLLSGLTDEQLFTYHYWYFFKENTQGPSYTLEHSIDAQETSRQLYLACQDEKGQYHFDDVYVGWDDTPPLITVIANPDPVTDLGRPSTTLSVTTDDRTTCTINGYPFKDSATPTDDLTDAYQTTHEETITYDPATFAGDPFTPRTFDYNIVCTNLAGLSATAPITVTVAFTRDVTITKLAPGDYTNKQGIPFTVELSGDGTCTITKIDGEEKPTPLLSEDGRVFTTTLTGMEEGKHTVETWCRTLAGEATKTFSFTIDRTPPTKPDLTAHPSCKPNRVSATFTAEDDNSVGAFNYTLTKASEIITPWTKTTKNDVTVHTDTEPGELYKWTVHAIDLAGNSGQDETAYSEVLNDNEPRCDFIKPTLRLSFNQTKDGGYVVILCEDEGSGCEDTYTYAAVAPSATCTPNTTNPTSQVIHLTSTKKICVAIADKNNNTATITKTFTIKDENSTPSTCTNNIQDGDETDIDCGGSCIPCEDGSTCQQPSDCLSASCNPQTFLCQPPSCHNNFKDGEETDVDCGGPSCQPCQPGSACDAPADCTSTVCENNACQAPSCQDSVQNGEETDVDCGGPSCQPCPENFKCKTHDDCSTKYCDEYSYCSTNAQADSDNDGMPDEWEDNNALDKHNPADAQEDPDKDDLTNLQEYKLGTDPWDPDTDGDTYTDGEEVKKNTDPLRSDSYPKSNLLALMLIILGATTIIGSSGYLTYARIYLPHSTTTTISSNEDSRGEQDQRVFIPGKDPLAEAARRRLEEKIARQRRLQKNIKRQSLFETFEKPPETSKKEIPITPVQKGDTTKKSQQSRTQTLPPTKTQKTKQAKQKPAKKEKKSIEEPKETQKVKQKPTNDDAFEQLEKLIEQERK